MKGLSNIFYNCLEESDTHIIDYTSNIDLEEGLTRIEELENYFKEHSKKGKPLKIILDARGNKKNNPDTHDALAKIARKKLMNKIDFMAVVNDQYNASVSENEHWFTNKEEAINWLVEQPI